MFYQLLNQFASLLCSRSSISSHPHSTGPLLALDIAAGTGWRTAGKMPTIPQNSSEPLNNELPSGFSKENGGRGVGNHLLNISEQHTFSPFSPLPPPPPRARLVGKSSQADPTEFTPIIGAIHLCSHSLELN